MMAKHVLSRHVGSSQVRSGRVGSGLVLSCRVESCHVTFTEENESARRVQSSRVQTGRVSLGPVASRPVTFTEEGELTSRVRSSRVMSSRVQSIRVRSCRVLSSHVFSRTQQYTLRSSWLLSNPLAGVKPTNKADPASGQKEEQMGALNGLGDYWRWVEDCADAERRDRRMENEARYGEANMAKVSEEYGGSFLKAADLQGKTVPCQVAAVTKEEFQSGDLKWVVSFQGKGKRLVLNKTNAEIIAQMHGDDMDLWVGKTIKIYPTKTNMQGNMVDCIRVKDEAPEAEGPDEIPF